MIKTLPSSTIQGYGQACAELAIDPKPLLKIVNLTALDEFAHDPVSFEAVQQLIMLISQKSGCEHFPLLIAKYQRNDFLGVLFPFLASAPNLECAWIAAEHYYQSVRSPYFSWVFDTASSPMQLRISIFGLDFNPLSVDLGLAKTFRFNKIITDEKWQPKAICFRRTAPKDKQPYEQFFNAPLIFDADFNGFLMEQRDLSISLAQNNPSTHLFKQAEIKLSKLEVFNQAISPRALFHITQGLSSNKFRLKDVAQQLELSERTLQRRLKLENTDFKTLLIKARIELGKFYLSNSPFSMTDISLRIGLQYARTFSTFFKNETGLTPLHWRKQAGFKKLN